MSKYNSRTAPSKKKLSLRRWHGPALVIALEGQTNAYLSFKGQLTKCSMEHIRPASTLEQIAASTWRDAIEEVVRAAQHDLTLQGMDASRAAVEDRQPQGGIQLQDGSQSVLPAVAPMTPGALQTSGGNGGTGDLPPVGAQEVIASLQGGVGDEGGGASLASSAFPSRRISTSTLPSIPEAPDFASELAGRLSSTFARARGLDGSGQKRPASVGVEDLEAESTRPIPEVEIVDETPVPVCPPDSGDEAFETVNVPAQHPLVRIQTELREEFKNGERLQVQDHGTWDGRWSMPSRSTWQAVERFNCLWPKGSQDMEPFVISVHEVKAARSMTGEQKRLFKEATINGWKAWVENDAIEVLSPEEVASVRARLRRDGEMTKILQPRFVFTDKNDGLRTLDITPWS